MNFYCIGIGTGTVFTLDNGKSQSATPARRHVPCSRVPKWRVRVLNLQVRVTNPRVRVQVTKKRDSSQTHTLACMTDPARPRKEWVAFLYYIALKGRSEEMTGIEYPTFILSGPKTSCHFINVKLQFSHSQSKHSVSQKKRKSYVFSAYYY